MQNNKKSTSQICDAPERGDIARQKLIQAGLIIYSDVGYGNASTRNIALEAGVNIAAIPYYFGSKEGLYLAVIDHIIGYYHERHGTSLATIQQALRNQKTTPKDCRALLDDYMRKLIHLVVQEGKERSQISHIYIREQLDPTSAFDRLYEGFIRGMQETTAALIGRVIGSHVPSAEAKLIAQTLLGQVTIFKSSRTTVLHKMGWRHYGEKELAEIERTVMFNMDALIQAYQKR